VAWVTLWDTIRRWLVPGSGSVRPVQLVVRYAYEPAVFDGGRTAGSVTAAVSEDSASEDDHVIVGDREIRVPAAVGEQRIRQRCCEYIGHVVVGLEVQERPDRGPRAVMALDRGRLPCSGGEARMLRIAASLGEGIAVDLREALTELDAVNTGLVARAIIRATGH
jgi:hypothetical protein